MHSRYKIFQHILKQKDTEKLLFCRSENLVSKLYKSFDGDLSKVLRTEYILVILRAHS